MKNAVQPGKVMTVVAGGAIVSGKLYAVGTLVGVATGSVESGQEYELALNGVVSVPNTDGIVGAQGALIGYDQANHKVVAVTAGTFDVTLFKTLLAGDDDAMILLPKGGY